MKGGCPPVRKSNSLGVQKEGPVNSAAVARDDFLGKVWLELGCIEWRGFGQEKRRKPYLGRVDLLSFQGT